MGAVVKGLMLKTYLRVQLSCAASSPVTTFLRAVATEGVETT